MDLAFIRNQIELKLSEFEALLLIYIEGVEKEFSYFKDNMSEGDKQELTQLFEELKTFQSNSVEMRFEFGIAVEMLTILHTEIKKTYSSGLNEKTLKRTSTFEGISITRSPLLYSSFIDSVGYNLDNRFLDVAYTSGSVYRYYDVPENFYHTMKMRNSVKGLKKELDRFANKKIG